MKKKIKVLQVIPRLGYGGAETGCYDLAHFLPEQGYKSYIATSGGELLKFINKKKVKIISFNSLTTSLCKKYKANLILRGLRAVSDFEYEFQLAGMNKKLNRNIETIFLMADIENQVISSSLVKEIAHLGGNMAKFTTKSTIRALKEKLR